MRLISTRKATKDEGAQDGRKLPTKQEYDFSKAERGKFHRKGAELWPTIYLGTRLPIQLERIARRKGKELSEGVKTQMELLENLP